MNKNPYLIPILFVATLEIVAFIVVRYLWPAEDNTVTIGAITLALGQVLTFLVNSSQAALATERADLASDRADKANDQADAAKIQVQAVSDQVEQVNEKSDEAITTSRSGLTALAKAKDLHEFDLLLDGWSKTTLTEGESQRLEELTQLRMTDDLTIAQLEATKRILEIVQKELRDPKIGDKPQVVQTEQETVLSKRLQLAHEAKQIASGQRKETPGASASADAPLTAPAIVEAAKDAAESAQETKRATETVVIEAAKAITEDREKKEEK
jgi:hypothetical protein